MKKEKNEKKEKKGKKEDKGENGEKGGTQPEELEKGQEELLRKTAI